MILEIREDRVILRSGPSGMRSAPPDLTGEQVEKGVQFARLALNAGKGQLVMKKLSGAEYTFQLVGPDSRVQIV